MSAKGWHPVTRSDPCEICGGTDNCTRSKDRNFIWCGRVSEGSIRQNKGGQFLHRHSYRPEAIDWLRSNPQTACVVKSQSHTDQVKSSIDWEKRAHDAYTHLNAGLMRSELSKALGVGIEALEQLGVGWLGKARGWSVPERDASGKVIGINRRLLDGKKRREQGSQSGLTFDPKRWLECEDNSDIYLIEGASDTAAMMTMKLSAVGRPSNLAGVQLLGELLKDVPNHRRIVVVGERDRKPHGDLQPATRSKHNPNCEKCAVCWPGWFGAIRTAEKLALNLNRTVWWTLPPEGSKDLREWLLARRDGNAGRLS